MTEHENDTDLTEGFETFDSLNGLGEQAPTENAETEVSPESEENSENSSEAENSKPDENSESDENKKPRSRAAERIRDLNAKFRAEEASRLETELKLKELENKLLQSGQSFNNLNSIGAFPDPSNLEKYPHGQLDSRYLSDLVSWQVDQRLQAEASAQMQRQQEAELLTLQKNLRTTVETMADRGQELYPDYYETVVDRGMRKEFILEEPTLLSAAKVDNGPQILYEIATNPTLAAQVASMSIVDQFDFVYQRNSELATRAERKPKAPQPPLTKSVGSRSAKPISPDTDDLREFEILWEQAGKR